MTDVALEWAERNVKNNPQVSNLIEIRKVDFEEELTDKNTENGESSTDKNYHGPPILVGVVKTGENFDFCMCNPPFFESMEEGGLNPNTSCGGTLAEMVCPGGEQAFISRIIEDSVQLKESFRYLCIWNTILLLFLLTQWVKHLKWTTIYGCFFLT